MGAKKANEKDVFYAVKSCGWAETEIKKLGGDMGK